MTKNKLLILGANPETIALVETAKAMGVNTTVTDFNPNAPAKKFADKSYDVDGMDIENIIKIVHKDNINGVLVGVADLLVPTYQKVCQILNFPCYANAKAIDYLSNKYKFKKVCKEHGIDGVYEFAESEVKYPALVKPVDSCSGQGITVCYQKENLDRAINKAKSISRSGQFIIEKYMTCDNVALYYTFMDGEYYLSAMGDMKTLEIKNGSPVNLGNTYPSKHIKLYLEKYHERFKSLFNYLEIKNGVMLIQAFVENNKFYVYDPGFRLQGEAPHILLHKINGFDHRRMLVNFAMTGKMSDVNFPSKNDCCFEGKFAATLWILLSTGKIKKIEGIECDDPRVVHISQRIFENDVITENMIGTEKQVFARLYLVCDSYEELKNLNQKLRSKIKVFNEIGENMVYPAQIQMP